MPRQAFCWEAHRHLRLGKAACSPSRVPTDTIVRQERLTCQSLREVSVALGVWLVVSTATGLADKEHINVSRYLGSQHLRRPCCNTISHLVMILLVQDRIEASKQSD